jgi:hypothetical protein
MRQNGQVELMQDFGIDTWLPDFKAVFGIHDTPTGFISWEHRRELMDLVEAGECQSISTALRLRSCWDVFSDGLFFTQTLMITIQSPTRTPAEAGYTHVQERPQLGELSVNPLQRAGPSSQTTRIPLTCASTRNPSNFTVC